MEVSGETNEGVQTFTFTLYLGCSASNISGCIAPIQGAPENLMVFEMK
jgi:hypothetical protein